MPDVTLRDYFIVHAPQHPARWFKPKLPAAPVAPDRPENLTASEEEDMAGVNEGFLRNQDVRSARLRAYLGALEVHRKAEREFCRTVERETDLQWPIAWADAMLERR